MKFFSYIFFLATLISCTDSLNGDHEACLDEVNKTYELNDLKNKVKHMEMCMMERGYHFTTWCSFKEPDMLTKNCYEKN